MWISQINLYNIKKKCSKKNMNPLPDNVRITRKLGFVTATALVVANMIGTGILTTSGIMAENLPNAGWVLFCWFFGGLIAISGALCYSELATRMPEEGGEYVYLKKIYHPSLGFLTGWTSFFCRFFGTYCCFCFEFCWIFFCRIKPARIHGD